MSRNGSMEIRITHGAKAPRAKPSPVPSSRGVAALMAEIERALPDGGNWCCLEKAHALAALVVGLRPKLICEIGIWTGGSMIPMLLALKQNGRGRAIAIDAWSSSASLVNLDPVNVAWWASADHDRAYEAFVARLDRHDVAWLCEVRRARSDDCMPPLAIDLLHVDGSHTEQAIRDVDRFAPEVTRGGILILDDVNWTGGHVAEAHHKARGMGFVDLYPLGTGVVMQRQT